MDTHTDADLLANDQTMDKLFGDLDELVHDHTDDMDTKPTMRDGQPMSDANETMIF